MITGGWLLGCSGGTGPSAGVLNLRLTTPNNDDGAVLLTVSGAPVDSLEAPGYRLYTSRPDPSTVQVIIAGDVLPGKIARMHVPDGTDPSRYTVVVGQVAARSSYTMRDPSLYSISVAP